MASPTPKSARQKAAEARAAAEAAEKRRRLLINVAIGAVLAVVVGAILFFSLRAAQSQNADGNGPVADAVQPAGAYPVDSPYKGGIPAGEAGAGKPVVEIWEDFQCPACKQFELAFGPTLNAMAEKGEAQIIWRSTSFLDANYPGQNSQRAAAAWGCAIDSGRKTEYHDLVYANQPAREGEGWSDQQLLAFAEQAGITGQAKTQFEQCFAEKKYMPWAANGTAYMRDAGIPGTPGVYVNGEELERSALKSPEDLRKAILDAGSAPSPSS